MTARHRKEPPIALNLQLAGREPALLSVLLGIAAKGLGVWLHFTTAQQALMNAVSAATVGLMVALATKDGQSAALLGAAQAVIALIIGLGLRVDPELQAMVMSAIALAVGMYERTQVTAPVPPQPR